MYKHILIPTDGSRLSEEAATAGIHLGKALGARLTAVHVVANGSTPRLESWAHGDRRYLEHLEKSRAQRAAFFLETIRETAYRAGTACECRIVHGKTPHDAIVKAALDLGCDLIVMGSHALGAPGRFGSETMKVLERGPVPVLVHH
jgi:nucleotide-binding universal stress UspA family protein